MSNALGWVIKLVSWLSIYFIIAWQFDGDMPFWAYFIVILLCSIVQGVLNILLRKSRKTKKIKQNKTEIDLLIVDILKEITPQMRNAHLRRYLFYLLMMRLFVIVISHSCC